MASLITRFQRFVKENSKVRVLLTIYLVLTIIGLLLSFLAFFIPLLTVCLPLFGHTACSSLGGYLLIFLNIPGYIVAALLITNAQNTPEIISLFLVGGISFATYYFLGRFFDRKKERVPLRLRTRSNSSSNTLAVRIILGSIAVLLLFFVYLMARLSL